MKEKKTVQNSEVMAGMTSHVQWRNTGFARSLLCPAPKTDVSSVCSTCCQNGPVG